MITFLSVLFAVILTVVTPYFAVTSAEQPPPSSNIRLSIERPAESSVTIRVLNHNKIITMPIEKYLTGVIFAEMPASFELEALKAQAVAVRTFAFRQMAHPKHHDADLCSDSNCCQGWQPPDEYKDKFGSDWEIYLKKVQEAVKETNGQVMTYNGEIIDAVYFSCSGGRTESAVAVWGSNIPYLVSVPSNGEEGSRKYNTKGIFSKKDFEQILRSHNSSVHFDDSSSTWLGHVSYTSGGGIDKMIIGGQSFTGTDLRSMFHLNSTKFNISIEDNQVIFDVYGAGHRVGMSQYGANAMAKAGHTYQEILLHYYSGVKIETKNP